MTITSLTRDASYLSDPRNEFDTVPRASSPDTRDQVSHSITEWEFTGDVVGWMSSIIEADPSSPFSRAKTEQRGNGSQKRRDVTLLDRNGNPAVTGEIKLPDMQDGGTPFNSLVVQDARKKAERAGVKYFFTWNVNVCVLWKTADSKAPLHRREFRSWNVVQIAKSSHLVQQAPQDVIRKWLGVFLDDLAEIVRGDAGIGFRSPDQKFMEALEAALQAPIQFTIDELAARYIKPAFKRELDTWMRVDQGWTIYDDANGVQENIDRAAKFACYSLVIKLVFHEALLKRFGKRLRKITIPSHIDTGDDLRVHLEGFFDQARKITGDYETVFGDDARSVGSRVPFYADGAVPHWVTLVNSIHDFDFSKLDYEVVGHIFERLIDPSERHKYGQYYTRVEIVDVINSFAIRDGTETVMDPACGGGTFLVRAYTRKRELAPSRAHASLLSDLFGIDRSHFATHLTTINLATRDLIDDANYPQVGRSDFFDVLPQQSFLSLPTGVRSGGLGKIQQRKVVIPPLDAIVGNPPYIRQEEIPKASKKGQHGTKQYYGTLVEHESGLKPSGRSDLHVYFWPHATTFLKPNGFLCFLTSSQWLDVEYGFKLQGWILNNFEIVAVLESLDEPWFVGARVATAVTVLRRQSDSRRRSTNTVRFVQLRRPVHELLECDGTAGGAIQAADRFRDEILSLDADTSNDRLRCRLVTQAKLWEDGVRLGRLMAATRRDHDDEQEEDTEDADGAFFGGKWGTYLRAPDLWFDLVHRFQNRMALLGDIVLIRRGITSGKDDFFFPRDRSANCLADQPDARAFELEYGVSRRDVASGRIKLVACGEKQSELKPIEAEFLEPELHSLMEVNSFVVHPDQCSRHILLVGKPRRALKGTHVLDYIAWGEAQGYHTGATCAARATEDRGWYDLTGHERGQLFWPKAQQYKHIIPLNSNNLQCNCNLYDLHVPDSLDSEVLAGILNSSIVILSKFQYGRPVGVEGNLKTEVVDTTMMLVPDPRGAAASAVSRVKAAFRNLSLRAPLGLLSERRLRKMSYTAKDAVDELQRLSDLSELEMEDRHELDDAVLALLGEASASERLRMRTAMYQYLGDFFEATRRKEETAISNKNAVRLRSVARPADIAAEIVADVVAQYPRLLRTYDSWFLDDTKSFDTYEIPVVGTARAAATLFAPNSVTFGRGRREVQVAVKIAAQVPLIVFLAECGIRGYVRVPHSALECAAVERAFRAHMIERESVIDGLIEERTGDEGLQKTIRSTVDSILAGHDATGSNETGIG